MCNLICYVIKRWIYDKVKSFEMRYSMKQEPKYKTASTWKSEISGVQVVGATSPKRCYHTYCLALLLQVTWSIPAFFPRDWPSVTRGPQEDCSEPMEGTCKLQIQRSNNEEAVLLTLAKSGMSCLSMPNFSAVLRNSPTRSILMRNLL